MTMNDKKLLAQHGLKWNPFSLQLPLEALQRTPAIDSFCRRVEHLAREGGFALLSGEPGLGKSSAMRLLAAHLGSVRELRVGELTRPQSHMADFYRELGELFEVRLTPHNRWTGTKLLRERWLAHIGSVLYRPVLLIDEAQEMHPAVLNELRLISSVELDSRVLLTVVLAGDGRLASKLRHQDLLPLGSRIRFRLHLEALSATALAGSLRQALESAGNARLMTQELIATLAEHAAGDYRTLMNLGADLLAAAAERDLAQLDEKLFFETYSLPQTATVPREAAAADRSRRGRR
jgi:type II secretory pathway predicted ATPase ExeA